MMQGAASGAAAAVAANSAVHTGGAANSAAHAGGAAGVQPSAAPVAATDLAMAAAALAGARAAAASPPHDIVAGYGTPSHSLKRAREGLTPAGDADVNSKSPKVFDAMTPRSKRVRLELEAAEVALVKARRVLEQCKAAVVLASRLDQRELEIDAQIRTLQTEKAALDLAHPDINPCPAC